jgi:MFS family permease
MLILAGDIRKVMWIGVVPAFLAVAVLTIFVREPERMPARPATRSPLAMAAIRRLSREFWLVVLLGAVFTLARFSEAFLVLRAQEVGLGLAFVPVVMIVMNLCYAGAAFPAGAAADRVDQRKLLLVGLVLLIGADLVLAAASSPMLALAGAALWGLHMAFTQGLLSKLVADAAPADLRGTAFGLFNLVSGGALLLANLIAGALWSTLGAQATFAAGAAFAAVAAAGVIARRATTPVESSR